MILTPGAIPALCKGALFDRSILAMDNQGKPIPNYKPVLRCHYVEWHYGKQFRISVTDGTDYMLMMLSEDGLSHKSNFMRHFGPENGNRDVLRKGTVFKLLEYTTDMEDPTFTPPSYCNATHPVIRVQKIHLDIRSPGDESSTASASHKSTAAGNIPIHQSQQE